MNKSQPDQAVLDKMGKAPRKRQAPTMQLTLRHFRKLGYLCHVSEHWDAFARRRRDLYNFSDLCAVKDGELLMIQTTTKGQISTRSRKMDGLKSAHLLHTVPGVKLLIVGWAKPKHRWEITIFRWTPEGRVPYVPV